MSQFMLGTAQYPLIDKQDQGGLGVRILDPIFLETALTLSPPPEKSKNLIKLQDYIYGEYIRNLPTRDFIPLANLELERRNRLLNVNEKTLASGLIGATGTGKTHYYSLLGRLTHQKGAILIDCSNMDMKSLFAETIFDTRASFRTKAAISARLNEWNAGNGNAFSENNLILLRQICKDAFIVNENNQIFIDWNGVKFDAVDEVAREQESLIFEETLKQICRSDGIDCSSEADGIGITVRDGPLFRIFDKTSPDYGRPIILDELNRAREGTTDNLYGILNFLNSPGITQMKIQGANGKELLLDKNDLPPTFFLNFTGNQNVEGMGSDSFNDPFLSRVPEGFLLQEVPETTPLGMADMICSYLMGVPGLILQNAFQMNGKKEFPEFLKKIREFGLTEEQKAQIPSWQYLNIQMGDKIIELSERMGLFLYKVKELAHLRGEEFGKIKHRVQIDPLYEEFLKRKFIDFRIIPQFFIHANLGFSKIVMGDPNTLGVESQVPQQPIDKFKCRGDNLVRVIRNWLVNTFIPNDLGIRQIERAQAQEMYITAMSIGEMTGVLAPSTNEARMVKFKTSFEDLYNHATRDEKIASNIKKFNPFPTVEKTRDV